MYLHLIKEIVVTYEDPELHKKYSGSYRVIKLTSILKKDSKRISG